MTRFRDDAEPRPGGWGYWAWWAAVGLGVIGAAALMVAAGWYVLTLERFDPATVAAMARESGPVAPLVVVGLLVTAVVIGPIPTLPITVAAGALFGVGPAMFYTMAGGLLGAGAAFGIARLAGQPLVARFTRSHMALCPRCSDALLFWVVLGSRLIPVVSFALVSYAAGLTAMRFPAFLLATAIGMLPMTALYVSVGASLAIEPWWAAVGGVVAGALVLGLPRIVERYNPFGLRDLLERHRDGPAA